jgi:hypothetical protein
MAGMPMAGVSTVFYVVLLIGMGATKVWRWGVESIQRIGKKRLEEKELAV